jgi:hypothetical protein
MPVVLFKGILYFLCIVQINPTFTQKFTSELQHVI